MGDDAGSVLYDVCTQWLLLPGSGAYKESNHYLAHGITPAPGGSSELMSMGWDCWHRVPPVSLSSEPELSTCSIKVLSSLAKPKFLQASIYSAHQKIAMMQGCLKGLKFVVK